MFLLSELSYLDRLVYKSKKMLLSGQERSEEKNWKEGQLYFPAYVACFNKNKT